MLASVKNLLRFTQRILDKKEAELQAINRYAALTFTPFQFIDDGEVQTSHLLAFFLKPDERHGQENAFQISFLAALRLHLLGCELPETDYDVIAERRHDGVRQMDLLIKTPGNTAGVCIENKLFAYDRPGQLRDYHSYLKDTFPETSYGLVYLTPRERQPDEVSISREELEQIKRRGQYINLTYESFLLPLLDEWVELTYPSKIKSFLRDWRYQLEHRLQLPSTAPSTKMTTEELADYLLKDADSYQSAVALKDAVPLVELRLKDKLSIQLKKLAYQLGLSTEPFEGARVLLGFEDWTSGRPFTIRRNEWGRYSIAFEFSDGYFYYGVRFERCDGATETSNYNPAVSSRLLQAVPDAHNAGHWFLWLKNAYNSYDEIYRSLIEDKVIEKVTPDVLALQRELDNLASDGLLK